MQNHIPSKIVMPFPFDLQSKEFLMFFSPLNPAPTLKKNNPFNLHDLGISSLVLTCIVYKESTPQDIPVPIIFFSLVG